MDTIMQIQGIKSQVNNMKLQIENIEMQNINGFMNQNPIGQQLLNLSMQMLNTGLQTFNIGSNLTMNANNFYEQLKQISDQINKILMPQQMMIQNMMFQQQMMQQQIMQQQMEEQQRLEQQNFIIPNKHLVNAYFELGNFGNINIAVEPDITTSELFEKLKNRIGMEKFNQIKFFLMNGHNVFKNDKSALKKYFPNINPVFTIKIIAIY